MKFLEQQTESPVALDLKEKELPLPEPGVNEHRSYFNHREEEREVAASNAEGEDQATVLGDSVAEPRLVKIPVADYVAASHPSKPTDEEWTECLSAAGYGPEQIAVILTGGNL